MFDTHTHLNFKKLFKRADAIIEEARSAGVSYFLVPSADEKSSVKAVELARRFSSCVFAAVGIHPHHALQSGKNDKYTIEGRLKNIENILCENREYVYAIGEIGLDKYNYQETKHQHYSIDENFLKSQRELCIKQLTLALENDLSVIIHNRETTHELLTLLTKYWDKKFAGRMVFHCCEAEKALLDFAIEHKIYIGVDGDVTYNTSEGEKKRDFVKKIPKDLLVLETDAPFLLPEPLRSEKKYPNTPANLSLIAECVAQTKGIKVNELAKITTENAMKLFCIGR